MDDFGPRFFSTPLPSPLTAIPRAFLPLRFAMLFSLLLAALCLFAFCHLEPTVYLVKPRERSFGKEKVELP